jgi:tetratricopeptide (TPR) repeat protein
MSLLIKALNKAEEKAQAQTAKNEHADAGLENGMQNKPKTSAFKKKPLDNSNTSKANETDLELSLSPTGSALIDRVSVADTAPPHDVPFAISGKSSQHKPIGTSASAKNAANVFSSKGMDPRNQNKTLAMIAGVSLVALLGMGFYYYQFLYQPDVVVPQRPILQTNNVEPELGATQTPAESTQDQLVDGSPEQIEETASSNNATLGQSEAEKSATVETKKPVNKKLDNLALAENEEIEAPTNQNEVIEEASQVIVNRTSENPKRRLAGDAIASESASIEVTKSNPQAGINPTLMSAYEAYNAGNDADAQKLYKQVLQRDIRNVDALLGLGAIASRQGRVADANGWYGKVLEIEPRNSMAQSAILDNQLQISGSQGSTQETESRLKNMLNKQPDDANLHVALGNYYAERNQWPSAQQSYFDAYSLNASADNALNLAVSLDHMGKPKLALPYYQRALELASSNSNIDKAALAARITAIQ